MNPLLIDEPLCVSFSGGRTSAYLVWLFLQANGGQLPPDVFVCFANTGKEDPSTLDFVHACEVNWNIPIYWLEYTSEDPKFRIVNYESASRDGVPFSELIKKRKYLPNPVARFCTSELKVLTIDRFMKSQGFEEYETMMGIRADEKRRAAKLKDNKLTPLIDLGVTQKEVQDFWNKNSFNLKLAFRNNVTALGNCDLCFLKGPNQIMSLINDNPKRAIWWAQMEENIKGTFRSDRPNYKRMMEYAGSQTDMFPEEESISCFCGD